MDPRRPVVALGHPPMGVSRHGSGGIATAMHTPRLKRVEPFEQDRPVDATVARPSPRQALAEKRLSLSTMQYDATVPTAALLSGSLSPPNADDNNNSGVLAIRFGAMALTYRQVDASPPGEFLASLRAKTLLDYDFMREFSLAKRKPMEDRNLSRMSASSVYSMQMAQMDLGREAQKLQRLQFPTAATANAKEDSNARPAAAVTCGASCTPTEARSARSIFRRNQTAMRLPASLDSRGENAHGDGSTFFPTLWRPTDTTASGARDVLTLKHRQPLDAKPADATPVARRPKRIHGKEKTASATGPLLQDGLSDFDLRKCHATSVVTAQHGFLQEQDLRKLLDDTGYDRSELYALWVRFKALCAIAKSPNGIDKDTFRRGIPQLSVEDAFFIDRVFDILDADGSGILEWQEFVEALSALEKGGIASRVAFLFRVYDLNGDGSSIHRNEVMQFFLASLLVETTDELVDVAKHFVGKIFDAVGCGDKDTMQIDDALRYMNEHPSADIYSLFGRTMVTRQRTTSLGVGTLAPGSLEVLTQPGKYVPPS